jgi:hypothetical protein
MIALQSVRPQASISIEIEADSSALGFGEPEAHDVLLSNHRRR